MFTIGLAVIFLSFPSETGAKEHSAHQLAQTLIRQHDALNAASLIYTSAPESRPGELNGDYWRRAISVNHAGMFKSDNSHGHDRMPWSLDPERKTLVITPAEATLLENLNRTVADFPYEDNGEAPAVLRNLENIFDVLCWWPYSDWPPPQLYGHTYSMTAMLNEHSYRLLPEKELVGSKQCYTFVVNDILTVWLDCDRPECVLKSERYNPTTKAIDSRFEMMEYVEVGDNIWFPQQFRIVRFDSFAHSPRLREKVIFDKTFLITDVKINDDVDLSDFRQEYAPGTVRTIKTPEEIQYEPVVEGQLDHFGSILNWCRYCSLPTKAKQNSRWDNPLPIFSLGLIVGCCLVGCHFLYFGRKQNDRVA